MVYRKLHLVSLSLIIAEICAFKQTADVQTNRQTDRRTWLEIDSASDPEQAYIHLHTTYIYDIHLHKLSIPFFGNFQWSKGIQNV